MGSAEAKLLYTLHWILLDAADECALQMGNDGRLDTSPFAYKFPLSAITVRFLNRYLCFECVSRVCFVYIFSGLYLPFRPHIHPRARVGLYAEHKIGGGQEDLAGPLGVSSSRC